MRPGVEALAKLPCKEVLIAQVLCGLDAPIQGFVNVMSGTIRGLVVALNAICGEKGCGCRIIRFSHVKPTMTL